MPVRSSDKVRASVFQANHSSGKIQEHLAKSNIIVSYRNIHQIIAAVRVPALIKKVAWDVKNPNPLSQRDLSRKHGIAKSRVFAILNKDLGLKFKKKVRIHLLLPQIRHLEALSG